MNQHTIIVINPYSHQGLGWRRWLSVKETVNKFLPDPIQEIILERGMQMDSSLIPLLQSADKSFIISAGGDGSIHYLVNTLLSAVPDQLHNITIGAIGLGSSNDFLKPFTDRIHRIPVRIRQNGPVTLHDVGVAIYQNEQKQYKKKYFIVNASFGVTAEANAKFNHPGKILQFLKKYSTDAAILYTAIQTILEFKNTRYRLEYNETSNVFEVSNINILKNPFVSGSFKYPQGIKPDDGRLGLNICNGMSKNELLRTLIQLGKGKFNAESKRISEYTTSFHISSQAPFIFECDGETEKANNINLSVLPKAIKILSQ